ncbi:MAG: ATP synthase F1 subunit epsilon [Pirellulaceae bacterium]|jgi:F-type H+-transporting ATPase subunit epsilon|nr:ATP synthase F1 subunit epsilon [Pirellulaceae bacterium]
MANEIQCVVVTPENTTVDQSVESVVVPLVDGEAGIYANHASMIGRLGCGEVRLNFGGKTERLFVDGGFVQVDDNVLSVITGRALQAAQIDVGQVESALKDAEASSPESKEEKLARARTIMQSKAMLKVAAKK